MLQEICWLLEGKLQDLRATNRAKILNKSKQQNKIIYRVKKSINKTAFWKGRTFHFLYHLAGAMY